MNEFILTLTCTDVRGIVASFATGLLELDAIERVEQPLDAGWAAPPLAWSWSPSCVIFMKVARWRA